MNSMCIVENTALVTQRNKKYFLVIMLFICRREVCSYVEKMDNKGI
jgi:hypothetical protein